MPQEHTKRRPYTIFHDCRYYSLKETADLNARADVTVARQMNRRTDGLTYSWMNGMTEGLKDRKFLYYILLKQM